MNRAEMLGSLALGVVLTAILFGPLAAANAADVRKKDTAYVTQKALGEVDRSSGWCDDATTTPTNVWLSSFVPAEIASTAAGLENRRSIRFLTVRHTDALNATVPMCARPGPNTGMTPTRDTLTCTGTAGAEQTNGNFFRVAGEGRQYTIAEIASTVSPELFVRASVNTVRYCVEVTWKS